MVGTFSLISSRKITYRHVNGVLTLRRQNTGYKNPKLVAQHCCVSSFWSMFLVFHLARSTCRAIKTFVAG